MPHTPHPTLHTPHLPVAFAGEPGSHAEAALRVFFGDAAATLSCESFDKAFDAVDQGQAAAAVLPLENTLGGSIHRNYDLMLRHILYIVGELNLPVHHQLVALPGARLEEIRVVRSHPQALAQCEFTLNRLGIAEREPASNTAAAAKRLLGEGRRDVAAIASRGAAELYGLTILAENVEDEADNVTRFAMLASDPVTVERGVPAKTSLVFALRNELGALYRALAVFALRDLNLTKLESRPLRGRKWEYLFYLDVAANLDDPPLQCALDHLGEFSTFQRVLGCYPRHVEG